MSRVLIIGCGGVASVAIRKCCQVSDVFTDICIASRTKEKCDSLKKSLEGKTTTKITTAKVDADNVDEVTALIKDYKPDLVMNIALPYQDLTIMDACLACGVNYMDTANYEPEDTDDPAWREVYETVSYTHLLLLPFVSLTRRFTNSFLPKKRKSKLLQLLRARQLPKSRQLSLLCTKPTR